MIESDSLGIIELVNSKEDILSEHETFIRDISILQSDIDVTFIFVPRNCNMVSRLGLWVYLRVE